MIDTNNQTPGFNEEHGIVDPSGDKEQGVKNDKSKNKSKIQMKLAPKDLLNKGF